MRAAEAAVVNRSVPAATATTLAAPTLRVALSSVGPIALLWVLPASRSPRLVAAIPAEQLRLARDAAGVSPAQHLSSGAPSS